VTDPLEERRVKTARNTSSNKRLTDFGAIKEAESESEKSSS